jgi:hypothetical protein
MTARRPAYALALALALAACGGGDGPTDPDAGTPAGPDDAYFGFADRRCLRFKDSATDSNYAIEMALDTRLVPGARMYRLRFKANGFDYDELWMEVTADSLLLHQRSATTNTMAMGASDPYDQRLATTRFTPALTWLKKDVDSTLTTKGSARVQGDLDQNGKFEGDEDRTVPAEINLTFFDEQPVSAGGSVVNARRYHVERAMDGGSPIIDKLWFAPGTGIVKFDPAGTSQSAHTLVSAGPMAEGETCD